MLTIINMATVRMFDVMPVKFDWYIASCRKGLADWNELPTTFAVVSLLFNCTFWACV